MPSTTNPTVPELISSVKMKVQKSKGESKNVLLLSHGRLNKKSKTSKQPDITQDGVGTF